jgi:hypothetical protein
LFNLFETKTSEHRFELRDTLFGDLSLAQLLSNVNADVLSTEPGATFDRARILLESGDSASAVNTLRHMLAMQGLESRHYLQAWHLLRELGEKPAEFLEKQLLGIVVEVGLPGGLDLLAAYADLHARYYNFNGAGVIWEHPNSALDDAIRKLMDAGTSAVETIRPWKGSRRAAPDRGNIRISLLTPGGTHFGEGTTQAIEKDPFGGLIFQHACDLMQQLVAASRQPGASE